MKTVVIDDDYLPLIDSVISSLKKEAIVVKKKNKVRYHSEYAMKKNYNMSYEDYEKLFLSQNGLCAICGRPETTKLFGQNKRLSIDHCHKSGKIRGLLCAKCNIALGQFDEDVASLAKAILYLEAKR